MKSEDLNPSSGGLNRYLSSLGVIALSFGYAVGWGAFVMPGTTFRAVQLNGGTDNDLDRQQDIDYQLFR